MNSARIFGAAVLTLISLSLPCRAADAGIDAERLKLIPARLHEAGVTFAIRSNPSGDQGTSARNLPYEAAMAIAYGLPEAEAVKALTIVPARIFGVDSQLGSLEVGKRANLVVSAGHILQPTTEVKGLFLAGKPTAPESRHTRLYAKFQRRLAEIKAGTAKLGIEPIEGTGPTKDPRPSAPATSAGGASGGQR